MTLSERLAPLWADLPSLLGAHMALTGVSLALAVALAMPLAVLSLWRPAWRGPLLTVAGITQTIPGLALLALMVPLLAGLDDLLGLGIPALGWPPTLVALTAYAILPILRNGVTGLSQVDADLVEAATGLGMTPTQVLREVQLPLAMPVISAGVRTAAVWTVGVATLATPVGQPCLGTYIFTGLQTRDNLRVVFGCLAAAALAMVLDALLGALERATSGRQRLFLGGALVALVGTGSLLPVLTDGDRGQPRVVVGTKGFTEQYILAALVEDRLRQAGLAPLRRDNLGSTVVEDALKAGELDVAIDYSGTIWTQRHPGEPVPSREVVLQRLQAELAADGLTLLGSLGFENAYALATRRDVAEQRGWSTIADLVDEGPDLVLGTDLEFRARPEWTALQSAYGLDFRELRALDATFMYQACAEREVDVITAYTTDGRLDSFDLVLLDDDRAALPPYDAILVLGADADPALADVLRPLLGAISEHAMREANHAVDERGLSPGEAAERLWEAIEAP